MRSHIFPSACPACRNGSQTVSYFELVRTMHWQVFKKKKKKLLVPHTYPFAGTLVTLGGQHLIHALNTHTKPEYRLVIMTTCVSLYAFAHDKSR
jgi:hypothetical protein